MPPSLPLRLHLLPLRLRFLEPFFFSLIQAFLEGSKFHPPTISPFQCSFAVVSSSTQCLPKVLGQTVSDGFSVVDRLWLLLPLSWV